MRSTSAIILTFVTTASVAQINKATVDSLILRQTDSTFFKCLEFQSRFEQVIIDIEKFEDAPSERDAETSRVKVTTFWYYLTTRSGQLFYYREATRLTCLIDLHFDKDGQPVNPEPLGRLKKVKSIYEAKTISASTAIEKARPYLKKKSVRYNDCLLVYDLTSSQTYWQVSSESGFRDKTRVTVYIDAMTAEFIRQEQQKFRKPLL